VADEHVQWPGPNHGHELYAGAAHCPASGVLHAFCSLRTPGPKFLIHSGNWHDPMEQTVGSEPAYMADLCLSGYVPLMQLQ